MKKNVSILPVLFAVALLAASTQKARGETPTIPKGTVVVGEDDIQNRFEITEFVVPEGVKAIPTTSFSIVTT